METEGVLSSRRYSAWHHDGAAGAVIIVYRLNYWVMYCNAREFVDQWYRFSNNFQKISFYIGGQIDILLMLGAMTALAFLVALINLRKDGIRKPRNIFLLTILIVYALPLIFGPNCLRIETARCFSWVIVVPRAFAAHRLMMSGRPTLYLLIATATSGLSYVG